MNNPYTVCFAYDKVKGRSYEDFLMNLNSFTSDAGDILYVRACHRDSEDPRDQRYIICIKKDFNDRYNSDSQTKNISDIVIKRFNTNSQPLKTNLTYGYFIKTDEIDAQSIIDFLLFFQNSGFLKQDSYEVLYPKPYPNGDERKYIVVTFKKLNSSYPKNFIKKFKTLINNSKIGDKFLKIKWVSNSVLNDIKKGESKEFKKPTSSEN